jgi:cell wall-associated NlpC family hydrolase
MDPIIITPALREAMLDHAAAEAPRECCGLLVSVGRDTHDGELVAYQRVANLCTGAAGSDRFILDPEAYAAAEDVGTVVAVVHSHPNASANPSMADRVGCERSGLPWVIVGWPSGALKIVEPSGWQAPYTGRHFHHGTLDCYTLIQDWFQRELSIELPDFDREDGWWNRGQDLYMQGFAQAGFVRVDRAGGGLRRHDVVLMQVRSDVANHGAVYLGDGTVLHHLHSRLSTIDVYGGYWERHTMAVLRHISQVGPAEAFATALAAA